MRYRENGAVLQEWLDSIAGRPGKLSGEHFTGRSLTVHPGTTIYGDGSIVAHDSFDPANVMVNVSSGCRFFGVAFGGNEKMREAGTMVYVSNATDVVFESCYFSLWRTLVGMAATNRVQFSHCGFWYWGDSKFLPDRNSPEGKAIIAANPGVPVKELMLKGNCLDDGGYAILGGNGSWPNDNVDIVGCRFHDGNWTAIDCLQPLGIKWRIIDTTIQRVHECGIYCGASAVIDRCTITDVRMRDCSAQCIEGGGLGTRITHCTFGHPDVAWLFLANPVGMYVGHNTFFDPMETSKPEDAPTHWSAGIFVRNLPSEHHANGLVIEQNEMLCSTGKATHCCYMYDEGGGKFKNVTYGPNRVSGTWKGKHLECDHSAMGENFVVIDKA